MGTTKEGIENATNKGYEQALVDYDGNAVLGAILSGIPIVGPLIRELLASKAKGITEKRLQILVDSMQDAVKAVGESQIDKSFFESEEFFDIYLKALVAVVTTRHEEKIKAYADILICASVIPHDKTHDPELYLTILTELLPVELQAVRALYELQKDGPKPGVAITEWESAHSWKSIVGTIGMDESTLRLILQRVERTGLVTQLVGYVDTMDDAGHFVVSDLLRGLITFLEQTSSPS